MHCGKDQNEALNFLIADATHCDARVFDWEDELCRALPGDGSVQLAEWAERNGQSGMGFPNGLFHTSFTELPAKSGFE
jgi:hypothetical protein